MFSVSVAHVKWGKMRLFSGSGFTERKRVRIKSFDASASWSLAGASLYWNSGSEGRGRLRCNIYINNCKVGLFTEVFYNLRKEILIGSFLE